MRGALSQDIFVRPDVVLKLGQQLNISLPDDERPLFSKLENIGDGELVLTVPVDEDKCPARISPGTSFTCDFFDGCCYYKFAVGFQRRVIENIPVWYTDKPVKVQKIQHREFVRIKFDNPLVVRLLDDNMAEEEMIFTTSVDLSGGGICFLLDRPLDVGKKITVEISEIPGIGLFNHMATVVRYTELDEKTEERKYHIGAQFTNIDFKIQDKIINYIFDLQRKAPQKCIRY